MIVSCCPRTLRPRRSRSGSLPCRSVMLFIVAGLVGVAQRPQSPVGALLVVVGFLYLVGRLQGADPPVVGLAANLANSVWQGIIFYVTFSFPTGRLRSPVDRCWWSVASPSPSSTTSSSS